MKLPNKKEATEMYGSSRSEYLYIIYSSAPFGLRPMNIEDLREIISLVKQKCANIAKNEEIKDMNSNGQWQYNNACDVIAKAILKNQT